MDIDKKSPLSMTADVMSTLKEGGVNVVVLKSKSYKLTMITHESNIIKEEYE
ncbi:MULTISPECIES: hypothetical protein [Mammaliicoccus]|uniref:hypothetical protein n=1 Tax=Mammaliicoccus TaxID=2803850 RepID=UPI0013010712|nr:MULTISPECIES: hypothetical protein [Mammaliicoccus]MCE4981457.1 hypothetical protein [Mammaliicoccus sciuri]MCE5058623.1 hypothetical protein [Mammaliicoccus sciuri]MCE5086386.1 hypothetical protein [Mammaliicoccus sciuri]MCE5095855.1 hypothetical protein [Mammaliicoccus sciuri]MDT0670066.1 hypothetical protein [Mammaliicoccus sciuri]